MIHISPWTCTEALCEQAGSILKNGKFLMIYGPFIMKYKNITQSNLLFDKSLKVQNPLWGIRDLESVNNIAIYNGFKKVVFFICLLITSQLYIEGINR